MDFEQPLFVSPRSRTPMSQQVTLYVEVALAVPLALLLATQSDAGFAVS